MGSTVEIRDHATRPDEAGHHAGAVLMTVLGVILTLAGALMLVYLGMVVVGILQEPGEVKLVELIMQQIQQDGHALIISIGEKRLEFMLGEPLRTILFVLVLLWILGAIAGIIKTIIGAGRDLITAGRQR